MLGLIAGRGELPALLAAKRDCYVIGLEGSLPDRVSADYQFRLEHFGSLISHLKEKDITQVCMAGGIDRPRLDPSALDVPTQALLPQIMQALGAGDDGALRVVISVLENAGFDVLGAHEILPELLMPPTLLGDDTDGDQTDVSNGFAALDANASADQGQALIIRAGEIIAQEGADGTAAMIGALDHQQSKGAILVKTPKRGQELRADMPTIGPETIEQAAAAGLSGIAISAGDVMVLDQPKVRSLCQRLGLFLWVVAR